jgi:elongation factor P
VASFKNTTRKPGKGGAFAQVEMKSVGKNTKLMKDLDQVKLLKKHCLKKLNFNYLYADENNYFFMDPKTLSKQKLKKKLLVIRKITYRKS